MSPTIPIDIAAALPWFAAIVAHYLMAYRLPAWKNALIAAVFVLATAILCAWLAGDFVPGNPKASVFVVIGYVSILMHGPLKAIMNFFTELASPLEPPPTPPINANPVRVPRAITLPGSSSSVPPRASGGQE